MKKFLFILIILILVLIGIIIYFKPSEEAEKEDEIQQEQVEKEVDSTEQELFDSFEDDPMFDDLELEEDSTTTEDTVISV